MPSRISSEIAQLASLARAGGLDLSQVSLRVKADLLLSTPRPPLEDLEAFAEMAQALIPSVDESTAVILARKLAGWRHCPAPVLAALKARGGDVLVALLRHGMPLPAAEVEDLAEAGDEDVALALTERADLTDAAVLTLVEREMRLVDLALAGNTAISFSRPALDLLIDRARSDAAYAQALLGRRDVTSAELTPLYIQAGPERRIAIIDSLTALDSLSPTERRPELAQDVFAGWLATAGDDPAGAFGAIAEHLGTGPALAEAMADDASRELGALAMRAAGASVEDATRLLIRIGDDAAHSVERIFALVALMRAVRPAVAQRIVMQIAGVRSQTTARKGRHQPALDPSQSPARATPAKPEVQTLVTGVMRKLGLRREG